MNFHALHHQHSPLLIANVWDAASARAAQAAGYTVLGTSSAALASTLGFADGENLPFEALLAQVRLIAAATPLMLSVDLEAGYADSAEGIAAHVRALAALGVVGINLEDSRVLDGQRRMEAAETFAARLKALRQALQASGTPMFINARTDAFLLGQADACAETLRRGQAYAAAGADGLFAPCVVRAEDIEALAAGLSLPLNVMAMPALPDFATLQRLGVRRISMGNWLHAQLQQRLQEQLLTIRNEQSFASVLGPVHTTSA